MVLSKPDQMTPLEVDTFDVEVGVDGQVASDGTVKSKDYCRDCVDLKTDVFGPKTDSLRAQTTLLTTGAAVGILWLTFG